MQQEIISWEINGSKLTLRKTLLEIIAKGNTIQCVIPMKYLKIGTMSHATITDAHIVINVLS